MLFIYIFFIRSKATNIISEETGTDVMRIKGDYKPLLIIIAIQLDPCSI